MAFKRVEKMPNLSQSLKKVLPRDQIEGLPEIHKAAVHLGGPMSGLLVHRSKIEDMVDGRMVWSETSLAPGPEMSLL